MDSKEIELAGVEFKDYPGEIEARWLDGHSYDFKVGDSDGMTFFCFATKIDSTVYFGNFGISTKLLDDNEELTENYPYLMYCTITNFPLLSNQ